MQHADMQHVEQYLSDHADRFVEDLKELLRIPSISADPAYSADVRRAAEFLRGQLAAAGLQAELIETDGHPIVYGEWLGAGDAPTAMIYGHYDVQPPDPLDQWISPPFEPTIRDGHIYARGATDDKGQMLTHVKAVEAWLQSSGKLPVNVKFVIEGEEEVGSRNLETFLDQHQEKVACDVAVVSDTSQYAPGMPAITYGLRGILACEVTLRGPSHDLHSGVFGGSVANPLNALARLMSLLHDESGRVLIPGFYDDVLPLTDEERQRLAELPFDDAAYLKELGADETYGEEGFTTLERRWVRPTCDINGLFGGYTGVGPKTIVPASATAKITCRLVPNQDSETLTEMLKVYLEANCPPGVTLEFQSQHGGQPLVFATDSPWMQAASQAIEQAFGTAPVLIREGGSIPVVTTFRDLLAVDTLLLGWGQNSDNLHSPNEHFRLEDFARGTRASACLWQELARG